MAFQLSPGTLVVEKDLTNVVPAVATSIGGFAGAFVWGPVLTPITISSELELVKLFGKPDATVAQSFFSAANFLGYSNNLKVVRVVGDGAKTAVANTGVASIAVGSGGTGYLTAPTVTIGAPDDPDGVQATATATLTGDAVTAITITNAGSGYSSTPSVVISGGSGSGATATATLQTNTLDLPNAEAWEANFSNGQANIGPFAAKYPGALGNSLKVSMVDVDSFSGWEFEDLFDDAPGTSEFAARFGGADDELHIIVVDENGLITGTPGTVLEKFAGVSKANNAKTAQGASNYYKDVLANSKFIWWMDHLTAGVAGGAAWGSDASSIFGTRSAAYTVSLFGGVDDNAPTDGDIQAGFDLFVNAELIDVNLLFTGPASLAVGKHVIENVAEVRKDCVVFVSPTLTAALTADGEADAIVAERTDAGFNVNSSYGFMDSGWKYQYDKYNDQYRWVPLNADIAGLCARTDNISDPWYSPGGFNRGQIKNVVKLAWSPVKTDRDTLYKKGINAVVSFPGEGTVLWGDKTLLSKPSAFDRINVRRLFIVLEKAIAVAANYQLFEFNDAFTRAQFRNLVEPFLRDIRGRRGIIDFRVVCDSTNNTGEVIDNNEFVADIYIKPARSINFITLNFVATRTGVAFEEIVGS